MVKSVLPLKLEDAVVSKRGKVLLGPVNLSLEGKGFTIILGPNGSGKTTLLRAMHGLERLKNGSVIWSSDLAFARQSQAFVFQTPVLLRRSVIQNLAFPLEITGNPGAEVVQECKRWLELAGLTSVANIDARLISGGEKQKLALARALIVKPQVLFLDEPTSNLDGQSTREIEQLLNQAVADGIRIVMATHDISQGKRLADEVWFLYRGKIKESSKAEIFFEMPTTAEASQFLRGEILE